MMMMMMQASSSVLILVAIGKDRDIGVTMDYFLLSHWLAYCIVVLTTQSWQRSRIRCAVRMCECVMISGEQAPAGSIRVMLCVVPATKLTLSFGSHR